MTGSLLALVAVGKQDRDLIGNPTVSFFKNVYQRHTHFSIESIPIQFDQSLTFGQKTSVVIPRKGDLLSKMVLEINLPYLGTNIAWINAVGHMIIKEITLEIGGVKIDSHTGEYLEILNSLELGDSKRGGYYQMIGRNVYYNKYSTISPTLYIPLQFWFCRHIGHSLPLVGLQYHEVKITIELRPFSECWYSGPDMANPPEPLQTIEGQLHCDYIFLAAQERTYFAKQQQKYLIEQVQKDDGNEISEKVTAANIDVHFNHPIKDLYWIYKPEEAKTTNDWLNFSKSLNYTETNLQPEEAITHCQWKINGVDLMAEKKSTFYRYVIPYQFYTRIPDKYIYVHTFATDPLKYQPTGHLNFSMLNSATLFLRFSDNIPVGSITVYARNYNILELKSGQACLLYSS
jgi:hypothetical protein